MRGIKTEDSLLKIWKHPFLLLLLDSLLINGCILATFSIRFLGDAPERNIMAYYNTWEYITLVYVILFYVQGLYDNNEDDDALSVFFKVFTSVSFGTIGIIALTFISRDFAFPRTVFIISHIVLLLAFSLFRISMQDWFLRNLPTRRVILYGNPARVASLEHFITVDPRKRFIHAASLPQDNPGLLHDTIQETTAECVIITDSMRGTRSLGFEIILKHPGVAVYLVPEVHDIVVGALHHTVLGDVPLIFMSKKPILRRLLLLKRLIDIGLSLLLFVPALPVLLLGVLAVKLTSRGPAFYTQDRVGKGGRLFRIIKLRTMVTDAEKATGPMLSTRNDPRVTPVGKVLRQTKIDELPQLFNVLFGQMSLVGPRPERLEFVQEFEKNNPAYVERKQVQPGMTGLAQVNGLYDSDADMKLKYDLLYIYNYHPLLDFAIMYQTVQHILRLTFGTRQV
jgi:exopolysaccharide biosynthesis polyprenyl glycosylphosphotransferase